MNKAVEGDAELQGQDTPKGGMGVPGAELLSVTTVAACGGSEVPQL